MRDLNPGPKMIGPRAILVRNVRVAAISAKTHESDDFSAPPEPARWFVAWFCRVARRRLRRAFHKLRVSRESRQNAEFSDGRPIVAYANHAAWWDPLVALTAQAHFLPNHVAYAPIDAEMLRRYGIFRRLGFFGVDRQSRAGGAIQFLRQSQAILRRPRTILLVTPQGRMADARERPVKLERGIAHLAKRVPEAWFVPLALEYAFWEESRPEALLHVGQRLKFEPNLPVAGISEKLSHELESAQNRLAQLSIGRLNGEFETLVDGSFGVGGIYGAWRRWRHGDAQKHGKL